MSHTNNPIIKHKTGLLNLVEELGKILKACKVMGVSRDIEYVRSCVMMVFYRFITTQGRAIKA